MSLQNSARVRKCRAQMVKDGNARMEVILGRKLIHQVREIARQNQIPFWLLVERALDAYATPGHTVAGNTVEGGNGT